MTQTEQEFQVASAGVTTTTEALAFLRISFKRKPECPYLKLAFDKAMGLATTFEEHLALFAVVALYDGVEKELEIFLEIFQKTLDLTTNGDQIELFGTIFEQMEENLKWRTYIRQIFDKADALKFPIY